MPPITTVTATKIANRVTSTVTQTLRKPTSPNHSQSTYASTRRGPTSSNTMRPPDALSSTRARRDNGGRLSGERVPICMLRDSKNPVPTGRYGRDGDAVW